jgi:hypothetical protein
MNTATPRTKSTWPRRVLAGISLCLGVWLLIVLVVYLRNAEQPWKGFRAPDDIEAGRELLASKFAGPRYFQFVETPEALDSPFIPVSEARRQMNGIVAARNLPATAHESLGRLVDALTEPETSRSFGVSHVNTLRLNLALDAATWK